MIVDVSILDTTPGAGGLFCPPDPTPDVPCYRQWLKAQYADPGMRQHIVLLGRDLVSPTQWSLRPAFTGPFAADLKHWLTQVYTRIRDQQRQRDAEAAAAPTFELA